ncbi:MAG: hypothetical protein AB8C13_04720 [Phycisphaerales bacterium]
MHQYTRYFRAFIFAFTAIIFLTNTADAQNIQPISDRIDAIVAYPLVLPVRVNEPAEAKSGLRIRLDDGRAVDSSLSFIWSTPAPPSTGWTKPTPTWNSATLKQYLKSKPNHKGTWIALIDLPIDAVGQGIWIDQTRYEPNWLPSPKRILLEARDDADARFWDPALSTTDLKSSYIQQAITNLLADPFNRWRATLMITGFHPDRSSATSPTQSDRDLIAIHTELLQSDTDQVLAQIADHFTARWQIILGRIWLIDPAVANRLKAQLTRTATTGELAIPLWTDDTAQLSALAHDLLSPFVNDELRVQRVDAWLSTQPHAMSWVIDDTGFPARYPPTLSPKIGLLWITNLPDPNQTSLARVQSVGISPHVHTTPAASLTQTTLTYPTQSIVTGSQLSLPRDVLVRIGNQRMELKALADIPLASPPGVLVGPLLNDWTLQAFGSRNSAMGALPPPDRRVAGLIHRIANLDEPDPNVGWRLYLECAINPASPHDTTIGISIGPMGLTRASWIISRQLGLLEMRTDANIIQDPTYTSTIEDDRWVIELDLPSQAITDEGYLIIGLERTDHNAHSSWPRRMMPWQDEPGRFVIDTTGWTGTDQSP